MARPTQHKLKIYTKTGDYGLTSLFGGKRVSKADLRVQAYGNVDELNSLIGVIISRYQKSKIKNELYEIQKDLLITGALLANPDSKKGNLGNRIREIENLIDNLSEKLPELKNFVLPGGGELGSILHFARSVCRRTERSIVNLSKKEKINSHIMVYFNRLSDLLFVMARFVNYKENKKEIIWS